MADLYQSWGSDLILGATGDLLLTDGSEAGRQRVLRRILTNKLDYLWDVTYGAGLPSQIGETTSTQTIEALVREQMGLEPAVAMDPFPTVSVTPIYGGMIVHISYVDAITGSPVALGFSVTR